MPATQFNRLTPKSILQLLDGHTAREEQRDRRVAWQTAHLLNVAGKTLRSRVTGDDLMGKKSAARASDAMVADEAPEPDAGLDVVALMNAAFGGTDLRES
jgi:hypothetical protein